MKLNLETPLARDRVVASTVSMFNVGIDSVISRSNDAFCALIGYPKDRLHRMTIAQITHPDDVAQEMLVFASVLNDERSAHSYDKRYVTADGKSIWAHVIVTVVRDSVSREKHYLCIVEEIRNPENVSGLELQREETFRVLVNGLDEYAIFRLDKEGLILTWNPGVLWNFGYREDEFVGKQYSLLSVPRDAKLSSSSAELKRAEKSGSLTTQRYCLCKDGNQIHTVGTTSVIRDAQGATQGFIVVLHDDTLRKQAEDALLHEARHDALTDLPNREDFKEQLGLALSVARRKKQTIGIFYLDIDNFKEINDVHGHAVGDAVLQEVAKCIQGVTRSSDRAARLSGDEFVLMVSNVETKEHAVGVAKKILAAMSEGVVVNNVRLPLTISIGISIYPDDETTIHGLLHVADLNMYQAKQVGGNQYFLS